MGILEYYQQILKCNYFTVYIIYNQKIVQIGQYTDEKEIFPTTKQH